MLFCHSDRKGFPMPRIRPARRCWRPLAAVAALALAASASYTVRPGDTLSHIAAHQGTTVSALADANGITDADRIVVGQRLRLPGSGGGASAPSDGSVHVVQPGEALSGIAAGYGVRWGALAEANGLVDPNVIRAGARLTIPGASQPATSRPSAPSHAEVERIIERVSREHGWSPAFVKAVAWQESGWNNAAVSHAGALGIMQVMPETGRRVSRAHGRPLDLHDPEDNVRAGVLFLDELYGLTGRDGRMTLAGYFQGLGNVSRYGLFTATERYIDNVLALRERFR